MKKEEVIKRIKNKVYNSRYERREVEKIEEIKTTWTWRLELNITYKITEIKPWGEEVVKFENCEFVYWYETGDYELRDDFNVYRCKFEEVY